MHALPQGALGFGDAETAVLALADREGVWSRPVCAESCGRDRGDNMSGPIWPSGHIADRSEIFRSEDSMYGSQLAPPFA